MQKNRVIVADNQGQEFVCEGAEHITFIKYDDTLLPERLIKVYRLPIEDFFSVGDEVIEDIVKSDPAFKVQLDSTCG